MFSLVVAAVAIDVVVATIAVVVVAVVVMVADKLKNIITQMNE